MRTPALPAADWITCPYKGLDHYHERDAPFFFGRKDASDLVVANLTAARLTLLYGASGVGKTSLLHAGVIPRLREAPDLAVVIFRSWDGDPVAGLAAVIREAALLQAPTRANSLAETIRAATERLGQDLVVILDQFEEYFVYHPWERGGRTFATEFSQAMREVEVRVSFLISIREDSLAGLDRFKGQIPDLFGNYLRVDCLNRQAGRVAIVRPIEEYRRLAAEGRPNGPTGPTVIEPELVEAVLDQVRVGNVQLGDAGAGVIDSVPQSSAGPIEAPYLQLVLTRLWEEECAVGSSVLRLATLDRLGGAERIIPAHLEVAMARLSRKQRNLAARILRFLVTPSGTKIAHRPSDLAAYADVPAGKVTELLDSLSGQQARILRGISEGKYEIYHDVLAAAILDWTARRFRAIRTARRRWWIGVGCVTTIAMIGGIVGLNVTPQNRVTTGLLASLISVSLVAGLASLLFGLGVRRGRKVP